MTRIENDYFTQGKLEWMETRSGKRVSCINPNPDDIDIIDIAWALSMQCRYAGHTSRFYSIAEHSVLVSQSVARKDALWGLLHDATEAYVTDIPKGLKNCLPEFQEVERRFLVAILFTFGLPALQPARVKEVDTRILINEKKALFPNSPGRWPLNAKPVPGIKIECLHPVNAFIMFCREYGQLTGQRINIEKLYHGE